MRTILSRTQGAELQMQQRYQKIVNAVGKLAKSSDELCSPPTRAGWISAQDGIDDPRRILTTSGKRLHPVKSVVHYPLDVGIVNTPPHFKGLLVVSNGLRPITPCGFQPTPAALQEGCSISCLMRGTALFEQVSSMLKALAANPVERPVAGEVALQLWCEIVAHLGLIERMFGRQPLTNEKLAQCQRQPIVGSAFVPGLRLGMACLPQGSTPLSLVNKDLNLLQRDCGHYAPPPLSSNS